MQGRTYDEAALYPVAPVDPVWALTWVRFWMRDKPDEQGNWLDTAQFARTDVELLAALELDSVTDSEARRYYRPHFTAARLYLGDPSLWKHRAVNGTSESRRDPEQVVGAWLAQGRAFDALIPIDNLPPWVEADAETRQVAERPVTRVVKAHGGW